jgi:predicted phosphodiesterase
MKIHILSDLHTEFSNYELQVRDADIIVLAGDISTGTRGLAWAREQLSKTKAQILYVAGNHEFYRTEMDNLTQTLRDLASKEDRIHFMENDAVIIDGVRFLGCTLWMNFLLFGADKRIDCKREAYQLNDFRLIKKASNTHSGGGFVNKFKPQDAVDLFQQSTRWLTEQLDTPHNGPNVVITHHLPSFDSVAPQYASDLLSACFASRLDHFFGRMDLWIHGHTHTSFDYMKDGTRVVCNPRGYCLYNRDCENFEFDPALVVEI